MDLSLDFIFCPLFFSLVLAGQYHFPGRCGWFSFSRLYCGVVLTSSCLNTIRHGFLYSAAQDHFETYTLVLFHMWTVQKTWTVSYFMFFGCSRTKLFMKKWQEYRNAYACAAGEGFVKHLRKLLIMFWSCMALLLLSAIIIYLTVKIPYTVNYRPFSNSTNIHWSFIVFGAFLNTTYVEVYFAPLVAIYAFCHAINTEFRTIRDDVRKYVTEENITIDGMEELRERHLLMCDVVGKFDDAWSPYLFVSMVLDVPMVAIHALVIISSFEPATMMRYIARVSKTITTDGEHFGNLQTLLNKCSSIFCQMTCSKEISWLPES